MRKKIRAIGHKGGPQHGAGPIQLSADGKLLAVGCNDGVYVYSVDSLEQVARLSVSPIQLAFTADGERIVTATIGDKAVLWEIATESKVWEITPNKGRIVRSVDASPDGIWIATGTIDNTARIWAAESGEVICEFGDHTGGNVFDVTFSRDSSKLATACFDGCSRVFDIKARKLLLTFEGMRERKANHVYSNVFSHDDEWMVTAAPAAGVLVWRSANSEVICECKDAKDAVGALFLPGNKRLLTSHYTGYVKLYDIESGKCLKTLQAHDGRTQNAALTPCGKTFVTTSMDAKIRLWDVETLTQLGEIDGHKSEITDLCYSAGGRYLATAHLYGGASLWDLETETSIELPYYAMHAGRSVAASRSGSLIAYDSDQHVYVYDAQPKERVAEFRRGHDETGIWWGQRLAFVGDDQRIAFASDRQFDERRPIVIWDVETKRLHRMVEVRSGNSGLGHSVVGFSPDGTLAVTLVGRDSTIVRLDREMPNVEFTLAEEPSVVAISPNNQSLCAGHENGTLGWRRTSDGAIDDQIPTLITGSAIRSIAFSADGKNIALSCEEETSVWGIHAGEKLATTDHTGRLTPHPRDHEFAIASKSQVHLWSWK